MVMGGAKITEGNLLPWKPHRSLIRLSKSIKLVFVILPQVVLSAASINARSSHANGYSRELASINASFCSHASSAGYNINAVVFLRPAL